MLQKLKVKNYQSHEDSELIFVEGINVIVGSSDAGKSVILRAVRKALFNRPLGTSFIRQGTKQCFIEIETANGKIERAIGKDNYYKVNEHEFRAVGGDVPEDVKGIINIGEINVQRQLDKHFLILGSGGEIASTINEVLNIDEIDKSISHCSSKIRGLDKEGIILKSQLEAWTKELDGYKNLDDITAKINEWKKQSDELDEKMNRVSFLQKLVEEIEEVQEEQKKYKDLDKIIVKVNTVLKAIEELIETEYEKDTLSFICFSIEDIEKNIRRYKGIDGIIKKIVKFEFAMKEALIVEGEYNFLKSLYDDIEGAETDYLDSVCDVNHIKDDLNKLKNKYKSTLESMDICPFCGREMDEDTCQKLMSTI